MSTKLLTFILLLSATATSYTYAQNDVLFGQFINNSEYVSLPHKVDLGMLFCCNERPQKLDSLLSSAFLPIDSLEASEDGFYAPISLYSGPLAWQASDIENEVHHIAIVWYAEVEEGVDSHYYGFLSTFSSEGEHIQTHQIAYHYEGFNVTAAEDAWLLEWLGEWSIVKGYYNASRGIGWSEGGFSGQELFAVKLNGHITNVTN